MKIIGICMRCIPVPQDGSTIQRLEVMDDGLHRMTCNKGHETITCLQQQSFEVLPELAVNAIIDGYYREAVASFASGLERFYEFYVKVICNKPGLENSPSTQKPSPSWRTELISAWNQVSKQSERQLGAYVFCHLLCEGEHPALLSGKRVEFRNNVIHRGYIPTRDEAIAFGNAVLNLTQPTLERLKSHHRNAVQELVREHMTSLTKRAREIGVRDVSTTAMPTPVSLIDVEGHKNESVEQAIERVTSMRARLGT